MKSRVSDWGETQGKAFEVLRARLEATFAKPGSGLSALQVVAIRQGDKDFEAVFGHSHIDVANPASSEPATMDTKFRVASISKPVTALGAMILVDEGRLDLDGDLSGYLGFLLRNPAYPDIPITAAMLLSHTSSVRDGDGYTLPLPRRLEDHVGPAAAGRGHWAGPFRGRDLSPGAYFCYSNLNYGVLATAIERITGQRFDLYMRSRVFEPLGIDAGYNVSNLSDLGFSRLGALYRKMDDSGRWDAAGPWHAQIDEYHGRRPNLTCRVDEGMGPSDVEAYVPGTNGTLYSPQGGLRISARDLAKILRLLMNYGGVDGIRLVSARSVRAMTTRRWVWDPETRNGSIYNGTTRECGLGLMRITNSCDELGGDRLSPECRLRPWCHHADAWGLLGGLACDVDEGWGYVYLISGTESPPERSHGSFSSWFHWEEEIQRAIVEEHVETRYRSGVFHWRSSRLEFGAWNLDGANLGVGGVEIDTANTARLRLRDREGAEAEAPCAEITSPVLRLPVPAWEAVPSWNARAPEGMARIDAYLRARVGGVWTKWYTLGAWSEGAAGPLTGRGAQRFSVKGQEDEAGDVRTDTLALSGPAEAFQLRFRLARLTGPAVGADGADVADGAATAAVTEGPILVNAALTWSTRPPKRWVGSGTSTARRRPAVEVPGVPAWSQMLYADGGRSWCSPTCLAMILEKWRLEIAAGGIQGAAWAPGEESSVRSAVAAVYDPEWGGCGNWSFNVAHAGSRGCDAFVVRHGSLTALEPFIEAGIPLALSVSWDNEKGRSLTNAPVPRSSGHLTLLVGFDAAGNPVMHEPAAPDDSGVRRVYDRAELESRWLEASGGATYVIVPRGMDIPGMP